MTDKEELQKESSLSDTKQTLERLEMKIDITRSAMEDKDAQVSSELKTVGGWFEEAWRQISEFQRR